MHHYTVAVITALVVVLLAGLVRWRCAAPPPAPQRGSGTAWVLVGGASEPLVLDAANHDLLARKMRYLREFGAPHYPS